MLNLPELVKSSKEVARRAPFCLFGAYIMGMILKSIRQQQVRDDLPDMHPGDTVRVHVKVVEGNRERVQVFEGVVIKITKNGPDRNMTVRRVTHSIGVERNFLVNSPRIEKIDVTRHGDVRRARLYYLRDRVGKAARIKEKRFITTK
jgi:large subunit ribosomal protein L19